MRAFPLPSILPIGDMLITIVMEMASLTECGEVMESVEVLIMIDMGYGEHHFASGLGMRLVVFSSAPFAFVLCPMESNQSAD